MKIERKDAVKNLWAAVEDTQKAIKNLAENPVVGPVLTSLWDSLITYQNNLKNLQSFRIEMGKFYKRKGYDDDYMIFRPDYFESYDKRDGLSLKVTVLTSLHKRFKYEADTQDTMIYPINDMVTSDVEEINVALEDLPLYINNEFKGTLYKNMLKDAGIPQEPETQEED